MHRRSVLSWWAGACALACSVALGSAGAASAAPGDTFYLGKKTGEHVFVSFVVRSGADEVSDLMWGVSNVPCKGHRPPPKPQKFFKPFGVAPIVDGAFRDLWSDDRPKGSALTGQTDEQGFSGRARIKFHLKRRGGTDATCKSGRREWSARPVSEERWNAARENAFGG